MPVEPPKKDDPYMSRFYRTRRVGSVSLPWFLPLSTLAFALMLSGCETASTAPVVAEPAASLRLSLSSAELDRGDTTRVAATLVGASGAPIASPSAGAPRAQSPISWSTSDPSIANISRSGLILAHREGEVVVTATVGALSGNSRLKVQARGKAIVVAPKVDTLRAVGHKLRLSVTVLNNAGREEANPSVRWTSLQPGVASVGDDGVVLGLAAGTAQIIAESRGEVDTARVVVLVPATPPPPVVAVVDIAPGAGEVVIGGSLEFTATVRDGGGAVIPGAHVVWSSSDPAVASVDSRGTVTSRAVGETVIRATADGISGTASIAVKPVPAPEYKVPARIDATGSHDVTAELLSFFATVPDGSTIVFPAGARYRIDFTLRITDRHGLTFEGNGAEFFTDVPRPFNGRNDRTRSHWHFVGGSELTVRNVVVRGAHPFAGTSEAAYIAELEAQHAFDVWGVQGLELDRVRATDVFGDFVYISYQRGSGTWSRNVRVRNSHFERNGRQGFAFAGTRDVVVENNYIGQTRRASLDFEPFNGSSGIENVVVRNNVFGPGRLMFIAAASSTAAAIRNITIDGNRLEGKTMNILFRAPEGTRHSNLRILNNVTDNVFGSPQALMRFHRVDGVEVRGNHSGLAERRDMTAVYAEESCNVVVEGNSFPGALHISTTVPFACS